MAETQEQWKLSSAHGEQGTCPRRGVLGRSRLCKGALVAQTKLQNTWSQQFPVALVFFKPSLALCTLLRGGPPFSSSSCVQKSSFSSFHAMSLQNLPVLGPSWPLRLPPAILHLHSAHGHSWHCLCPGKTPFAVQLGCCSVLSLLRQRRDVRDGTYFKMMLCFLRGVILLSILLPSARGLMNSQGVALSCWNIS